MHDARSMRGRESVAQLREDLDHVAPWQRALRAHDAEEIVPAQQLHRDPRDPGFVVDPGADDLHHVVARNVRADGRFLFEAIARNSVGEQRRPEHLERALFTGADLFRAIEQPHPAFVETRDDAVVRCEDSARLERDVSAAHLVRSR